MHLEEDTERPNPMLPHLSASLYSSLDPWKQEFLQGSRALLKSQLQQGVAAAAMRQLLKLVWFIPAGLKQCWFREGRHP